MDQGAGRHVTTTGRRVPPAPPTTRRAGTPAPCRGQGPAPTEETPARLCLRPRRLSGCPLWLRPRKEDWRSRGTTPSRHPAAALCQPWAEFWARGPDSLNRNLHSNDSSGESRAFAFERHRLSWPLLSFLGAAAASSCFDGPRPPPPGQMFLRSDTHTCCCAGVSCASERFNGHRGWKRTRLQINRKRSCEIC